jgi:hypothetical protein
VKPIQKFMKGGQDLSKLKESEQEVKYAERLPSYVDERSPQV